MGSTTLEHIAIVDVMHLSVDRKGCSNPVTNLRPRFLTPGLQEPSKTWTGPEASGNVDSGSAGKVWYYSIGQIPDDNATEDSAAFRPLPFPASPERGPLSQRISRLLSPCLTKPTGR